MDEEIKWIRQIQHKSDKKAANALVDRYYREIYGFVRKQTSNPELALDLTQEVFISALQSLRGFDGSRASFRTWLYRIASNRIVDHYRSAHYRYAGQSPPIAEDWSDGIDFTLEVERRDEAQQVLDAAQRLEPTAQLIFRLKFFADCTFSEIAGLLKLSESTVKSKYYALIRKIQHELGGDRS
ncbi:RNA polymerase sigma factor [Saccharibacillus kuerlensis]|uniref:RNA polymerase sigma factor n=1 Tax=Saccharibacillus kuerlensis TaxID=459527 RepID=A0ABQ2KSX3_9BACL|nr:sigma-70 family RNA polymerase sigma factor [Saccharibacillus kuerlensis]GGN91853.1 ECF subfamily RNA polymerase sigma factor [Saccharibacillus kuerlensis]